MTSIFPLHDVFPEPATTQLSASVCLPAVVCNAWVLMDYASTGSTTPTPWPWDAWARLDEAERGAMATLRPVLVHGLILQEHWLRTLAPSDPAWREMDALNATIDGLPDDDVMRLVAEGWVSGTRYYLSDMPSDPEVDALLPPHADEIEPDDLVRDRHLLTRSLPSAYASWGVPASERAEKISRVTDPNWVRAAISSVLSAIWAVGLANLWESAASGLQDWADDVTERARQFSTLDPVAIASRLTGREMPPTLQPMLEGATTLDLLPCLEMGSTQRAYRHGDTAWLMFGITSRLRVGAQATDPMEIADAVNIVRAIADAATFSIVQALAADDSPYAAQVVEATGIHQSTVSRHLTTLERLGVVQVRREGKTKSYALDHSKLTRALAAMEEAIRS